MSACDFDCGNHPGEKSLHIPCPLGCANSFLHQRLSGSTKYLKALVGKDEYKQIKEKADMDLVKVMMQHRVLLDAARGSADDESFATMLEAQLPARMAVPSLNECIRSIQRDFPPGIIAHEVREARSFRPQGPREGVSWQERYDGLTDDDRAILVLYCREANPSESSFYCVMNGLLRRENVDRLQPWLTTLRHLVNSLMKLPRPTTNFLFRGAKRAARDLGNQCLKDATFTFPAFTSTSTKMDGIRDFVGTTGDRVIWVLMMMDGYFGRDVRDFSQYDSESEVLLAPLTKFEVVAVMDLGNNLTQVQCRQVEGHRLDPQRI